MQTPQGVRYTRDGNFYKAASGQLQTVNGQAVLDNQGRPITIPARATMVTIGEKGQIMADNQPVATLQFVQFGPDRQALLKQGNSLYYPQAGAQAQPATGTIQQGMLENSNTNVITEMVELINNYRIYEAGSKAVTSQDALLDKAVNEVGKI